MNENSVPERKEHYQNIIDDLKEVQSEGPHGNGIDESITEGVTEYEGYIDDVDEYVLEIQKLIDDKQKVNDQLYEHILDLREKVGIWTDINKINQQNLDRASFGVTLTDLRLQNTGRNKLIFIDDNARPLVYTQNAEEDYNSGVLFANGEVNYLSGEVLYSSEQDGPEIIQTQDGEFVLKYKSGLIETYNYYGALKTIENSYGDSVSFIYNEKGYLIQVKDSRGREMVLNRTGDRIDSLTDPKGNSIHYDYDGENRLHKVTDRAGNEVIYHYNNSYMTKIIKDDGSCLEYLYDSENRVQYTVDEEGNREVFEYHPHDSYTLYTNPSGIMTRYDYNDKRKVVQESYVEQGRDVSLFTDYDPLTGQVVFRQDALNRTKNILYNSENRITDIIFHDNTRMSFTYNEWGQTEEITDRQGQSIVYSYNSDKNIDKITYPRGLETVFTYEKGRLSEEISYHFGEIISEVSYRFDWNYDEGLGETVTKTDGDGVVSSFSYDRNDLLKEVKNSQEQIIVSYEYDEADQLTKEIYHLDNTTAEYVYSGRKTLVYSKDRQGVVNLYRYDKKRQLINRTVMKKESLINVEEVQNLTFIPRDEDIHFQANYQYRPDGKLLKEENNGEQTFYYEYDARGRLLNVYLKETRDLTNFKYDIGGRTVETGSYTLEEGDFIIEADPDGKTVKAFTSVNPDSVENGLRTVYEYNDNDFITRIDYPDGSYEEYSYNLLGEILTKTNRENPEYITNWERDSLTDDFTVSDSLGILYQHKKRGRLEVAGRGENPAHTVEKQYTTGGRLAEVHYGNGTSEIFTYDSNGNISTHKDIRDVVREYEYDRENNVTKIFVTHDGIRKLFRSFEYHGGRLISWLNSENSTEYTEKYEYNERGLVSKRFNALKDSVSYKYNSDGKVIEYTDYENNTWKTFYNANGSIAYTLDPLNNKTEYKYSYSSEGMTIEKLINGLFVKISNFDKMNRLVHTEDGDGVVTVYTYDKNGNRTSEKTGQNPPHIWEFNERSYLVKEINKDLYVKEYKYSDSGNLKEVLDYGAEEPIVYNYDDYDRIASVIYPDGSEKSFSWNRAGDLLEVVYGENSSSFEYNSLGQLIKSSGSGSQDIVEYTYNLEGLIEEISVNGVLKNRYTYNELHDVKEIVDVTRTVYFEYNRNAQEIRRSSMDDISTRTYDEAGRITSILHFDSDKLARAETYAYNSMGLRSHITDERGYITSFEYTSGGRLNKAVYPKLYEYIETTVNEYKNIGLVLNGGNSPVKDKKGQYMSLEAEGFTDKMYTVDEMALINESFRPVFEATGTTAKHDKKTWAETFQYNSEGNRTEKASALGVIEYLYENDRMVQAGNKTYGFDVRGNMIHESVLGYNKEYQYNLENRMISYNDSYREINYSYDGLGRRVSREEIVVNEYDGKLPGIYPYGAETSGVSSFYVYEGKGFNVLKEVSSSEMTLRELQSEITGGSPGSDYYSPGITVKNHFYKGRDQLGTREITGLDSQDYYNLHNSLGSVIAVEGHTAIKPIHYKAFGEEVFQHESYGDYRYNGKLLDRITGLYNYGYRDYNPLQARFSSEDPIKDGVNWYVYTMNDPVNKFDPDGLVTVIDPGMENDAFPVVEAAEEETINKEDVNIFVRRTPGHKDGHFKSVLTVEVNGEILYQEDVQSYADYAKPGDITLPAGTYEGTMLEISPSYTRPIKLVNEELGAKKTDAYMIHASEFTNGDRKGVTWRNTGFSRGCQITQGQAESYDNLADVLEDAGFAFDGDDTINVHISDPPGIRTTKDHKEVVKDQ